MRKTLRLKLSVLLTSFLLISCSSCKDDFSWNPKPYVGDSLNSQIVREDGSSLRCDEPRFNKIVCLDEKDITDLVVEIAKHSKKAGKVAKKKLRRVKELQKKVK